ncbi:hypothetical protein ACLMJK_001349 [Lecanora helva]
MVLANIPTAAMGWRYSSHKPGTTKDADFWFLLQSSCVALASLVTLGIPIWRRRSLPGQSWLWTWAKLAIAALCACMAPVCYIFLPTEWSQYVIMASGIIQAFVTLEIALVAEGTGAKVVKQD